MTAGMGKWGGETSWFGAPVRTRPDRILRAGFCFVLNRALTFFYPSLSGGFREGWPSGLRHQSRKLKYGQLYREFKSHLFRHRI